MIMMLMIMGDSDHGGVVGGEICHLSLFLHFAHNVLSVLVGVI